MEKSGEKTFQGVVCCHFGTANDEDVLSRLDKLLDLNVTSVHQGITCKDLELNNKYYKTTIQLLDHKDISDVAEEATNILKSCQAIIFYGHGQKIILEQMDERLSQLSAVEGEPRILLYDQIDENCESYPTLRDWCVENSFDFIDATNECASKELIDSLSAYKWLHRTDNSESSRPELNEETVKKLMDFDSLLGKLSAYRDRPEMRGDPNDKNIVEIAEILSGLLSDDVDNFLDNEDER